MSGWKEDDVSKVGVTWEFVGLMDDTKAVSVVDMGGGGMDFISTFWVVGSQFWTDVTIYGIGHVYGAAWSRKITGHMDVY